MLPWNVLNSSTTNEVKEPLTVARRLRRRKTQLRNATTWSDKNVQQKKLALCNEKKSHPAQCLLTCVARDTNGVRFTRSGRSISPKCWPQHRNLNRLKPCQLSEAHDQISRRYITAGKLNLTLIFLKTHFIMSLHQLLLSQQSTRRPAKGSGRTFT